MASVLYWTSSLAPGRKVKGRGILSKARGNGANRDVM